MSPQLRQGSRPPDNTSRASRNPPLSTGPRKPTGVVAAAFERLSRRSKNKGQILAILVLGILVMFVALVSSMRSGEELGGEMRTKSLVYAADPQGKIGLYWVDNEANTRKATSEEIERCEELHPDEAIPICQTTYYEKDENEQ